MTPMWSDEAKRISDAVNMHSLFDSSHGKYLPISLQDGRPLSNDLYDLHRQAVNATLNKPGRYAILRIPFDGMPIEDAEKWLSLMRKIDDAGFRMTDPDGPAPVLPQTTQDLIRAVGNPAKNVRFARRVD